MKKILKGLIISLALAGSAYAQNKVEIKSYAFLEVTKTVDGKEVKSLEKAVSVVPGQTVVFKNIVENKNKTPAKDIVVTNQIPQEISFISSYSSDEKGTEYTYSVDGVNFQIPSKLFIVNEVTKESRLARPEEYRHIRWNSKQGVLAENTLELGYRGSLK